MLTPQQIESIRNRTGIKPAPVDTTQVVSRLDAAWGNSPKPETPQPNQVETLKTFGGDVKSSFKSAQDKMSDVYVRNKNDKQGLGTSVLQALGVGAKLGNDIIGHGVKAIIDLSLPKEAQSAVGSALSTTINSSPLLRQGLEAAKGGMESYNAWKEQNPKEGATLDALVNIPLFALQFVGAGEAQKVGSSFSKGVERGLGANSGMTKLPVKGLLDAEGEAIVGISSKIPKGEMSFTKGPIDVVKTPEGYMILDGQHRASEALKSGIDSIDANVLLPDQAIAKYGETIPGLEDVLSTVPTQSGSLIERAGEKLGEGYRDLKSGVEKFSNKISTGKAISSAEKASQRALDAITPKTSDLTPAEYGELLKKGKVGEKTAGSPAQYILSDSEKGLAQKYAPLLQGKDPVANSKNVLTEIINKDARVEKFLETQNKPYIKADLQKVLSSKLSGVNDVMVPSEQLRAAKKDLIDTIMKKLPDDNLGRSYKNLWQFRKELDRTLESKLKAFSGNPSLKKEMGKALRNGIQDFIAANTKDTVYSTAMKDMSQLYDLQDMIITKALKEKNLTGLDLWIKENPRAAETLKLLGYGTIGAAGVKVLSGGGAF